jgi:hypothetical protein
MKGKSMCAGTSIPKTVLWHTFGNFIFMYLWIFNHIHVTVSTVRITWPLRWQKLRCIWFNLKFRDHIQKRQLKEPILRPLNLVQNVLLYSFYIWLNVIRSFMTIYFYYCLNFLVHVFSPCAYYMLISTHPSLFYHNSNDIWRSLQIINTCKYNVSYLLLYCSMLNSRPVPTVWLNIVGEWYLLQIYLLPHPRSYEVSCPLFSPPSSLSIWSDSNNCKDKMPLHFLAIIKI